VKIMVAPPVSAPTPASGAVTGLTDALIRAGARPLRRRRQLGRVLRRLPLASKAPHVGGTIILPMMGWDAVKAAAYGTWSSTVPVCWDVWEPQWPQWVRSLEKLRPQLVFVTAQQSAEYLAEHLPMPVLHLPEATTVSGYQPGLPLAERSIDVLELGRRDEEWHAAALRCLSTSYRHHYEQVPGQIIFPTRQELVAGLADARISICIPGSMTNAARCGTVETATHRYFESFASRALVLGHAPDELLDLFGYNPVVEIDWQRPAEQLLALLSDISTWQAHVDRNYQRVLEVGDWAQRAATIMSVLSSTAAAPVVTSASAPAR